MIFIEGATENLLAETIRERACVHIGVTLVLPKHTTDDEAKVYGEPASGYASVVGNRAAEVSSGCVRSCGGRMRPQRSGAGQTPPDVPRRGFAIFSCRCRGERLRLFADVEFSPNRLCANSPGSSEDSRGSWRRENERLHLDEIDGLIDRVGRIWFEMESTRRIVRLEGMPTITLALPPEIVARLETKWPDLPRVVLVAMLASAYREDLLTAEHLRRTLGLNPRMQVDEFLKDHEIVATTPADFERDRETLRKIRSEQ